MSNPTHRIRRMLIGAGFMVALNAQTVHIEPAAPLDFNALVDSNSPAYIRDGRRYLFTSLDMPIRSEGSNSANFGKARAVIISGSTHYRWIESAWVDTDGTVYAWYHAEPSNVCPGLPLTAPQIGALISSDGVTFRDLGIVLRSPSKLNCQTRNTYFAGGQGDFTVIPDRDGAFFYFVFTNYGGPVANQGIAVARMAMGDKGAPAGHVWKFFGDNWNEPGLGGRVTPIFPARADWSSDNPDSFWGPAIHWNTALQQYVVLMNHVGDRQWSQEGVYASVSPDISNPMAWSTPFKLIDGVGWYPQVLGCGPGETDTLVGAEARLFVMGHSEWTVTFDPSVSDHEVKLAPRSSSTTPLTRHY